ncbi:MAG: hypothetical protein HYZ75_09680 [Elusimicrobia bacterium]|nr:hypothetical protein [Elusimicrobiota bacterium]
MNLPVLALAAALVAAPAAAQNEEGEAARPSLVRPGGFLLFYDSQGPLSFVAPTRRELPPDAVDIGEVRASACQHGLSIPLSLSLRASSISAAAGRGGFERTMEKLKTTHPDLRGVYDVKVDERITSILGVWRRVCAEVTARGFR